MYEKKQLKNICWKKGRTCHFEGTDAPAGAELVAILGRRRIGKTYLVKQAYATELCFHFTGIKDANRNTMLVEFKETIMACTPGKKKYYHSKKMDGSISVAEAISFIAQNKK